ncbi:MAG: DUF1501 domain-containing protein [Rhodospirillales bacterium]|nr:DUF1501 domain-containing protein [Rhodospirillales bacterium]
MCHEFTRRSFLLGSAGAVSLPTFLGGFSSVAFANVPTNKRLTLVFLRGGMDSLGVVVPYADPAYASIRKNLAIKERDGQMIDADGFFAFHKNLSPLHDYYKKGQMAVIHAVATPYRERSHFDAQDLLENGTTKPNGSNSGWLNRAIQAMGGSRSNALGLSIGPSTQTILRGEGKVTSWSPSYLRVVDEDLLGRITRMYEKDALLHQNLQIAQENMGIADTQGKAARGDRAFITAMEAAAKFLAQPSGPRVAVVDMSGWDTHANQGSGAGGRLPGLLKVLSEGVTSYRQKTPDAVWNDTIIYIVTEFGRTVRPNGSGGTDHGTAGLSMVLGGRLKGGRVISDWPGLAENKLYENRDLRPTTDLRAASKAILTNHFGISNQIIDRNILPGSSGIRTLDLV